MKDYMLIIFKCSVKIVKLVKFRLIFCFKQILKEKTFQGKDTKKKIVEDLLRLNFRRRLVSKLVD